MFVIESNLDLRGSHCRKLCFAKFPWQPLPCLAPLMLLEAQHCLGKCQVARHVWNMQQFETEWSYLAATCLHLVLPSIASTENLRSKDITICQVRWFLSWFPPSDRWQRAPVSWWKDPDARASQIRRPGWLPVSRPTRRSTSRCSKCTDTRKSHCNSMW